MSSTFDPIGGTIAKDEAIERVKRHADPQWWAWMLEGVKEVAQRKPVFNTDDIERLRQDRQGPRTHENRAIGPLMKTAQKLGYCIPTEDWVESSQKVNHRRPMRVWYSLIYKGPRTVRKPRTRVVHDPRQYNLLDD